MSNTLNSLLPYKLQDKKKKEKTLTTRSTSKIPKSELPPTVPEGSIKVEEVDPQALENRDSLWILRANGSLVNIGACTPQEYDEVISEYVDLYDRTNWPLYQRAQLIVEAGGAIPVFFIPEAKLPEDLKASYTKPETVFPSVQIQELTSQTKQEM